MALSPDGQSIASAYRILNRRGETEGFKIRTHTYVDRLLKWIPMDEPLIVTVEPKVGEVYDMVMVDDILAFSHVDDFFFNSPDEAQVRLDLGTVHVWTYGVGPSDYPTERLWVPYPQSIVNTSPQKETELFGYSVSTSPRNGVDLYVAVGVPVQGDTSNPGLGRVEVYTPDDDKWVLVGSPIVGDTNDFGTFVRFSYDGNVLAVVETTGFDGEMQLCSIRVFEFSEETNDWVQKGQSISSERGQFENTSFEMSADGSTIVAGVRQHQKKSHARGHVRVWSFQSEDKKWLQKGEDLDALVPDITFDNVFGSSFALSSDGSRVAVSTLVRSAGRQISGTISTFLWNNQQWNLVGGPLATDGVSLSLSMDIGGRTMVSSTLAGFDIPGSVTAFTWVDGGSPDQRDVQVW